MKTIICPNCGMTFDERVGGTPPIIPPVDPPVQFKCSICGLSFTTQELLNNHVKTTHSTYTKLNKIAPMSGDFYGLGIDRYLAGQTKKYILPLSEVYPGMDIRRLYVTTIAELDGRGDVDVKLTSPDGLWTMTGTGPRADEIVSAVAKSWPMGTNYPGQYVQSGNWTLEITAKIDSSIKIWWKCM